jgi:hypothetical protein
MGSEQIDKVRPFLLPSSIPYYLRLDPTYFNIFASILASGWATDVVGRCGTGRGRHVARWQLCLTHGHRFSAARLAPWQAASPGVRILPCSVPYHIDDCGHRIKFDALLQSSLGNQRPGSGACSLSLSLITGEQFPATWRLHGRFANR